MTAVILIGIPASGKSTFCRERLFNSHVRINLEMLKTRHREKLLFQACLAGRQPFVIDNTNASAAERQRYLLPAREAGFRIIGYYFSSRIQEALERNRQRAGTGQIPDKGVLGIAGRLELPARSEGFDELWYVRMDGNGGFAVEGWRDEPRLQKVVSGGQSGVDRAALDVAMELKIVTGGWCPAGRRAEDGVIPERYPLQETSVGNYAVRTRWNVRDSDGTLVLTRGELGDGTLRTVEYARKGGRPCLVIQLDDPGHPAPEDVHEWLSANSIRTLNVAGPRESKRPGIYRQSAGFLRELFKHSLPDADTP